MKKLAVFLADGFEEIEGLTVVDLCRRAGLSVVMVSVSNSLTVTGSHGIEIKADELLSQTDFQELDMLILPGGKKGTQNLESCTYLMEQLDASYAAGRQIAAICAAPSILGHRGILKGRKACCYPGWEAHLEGADVVYEETAVSGNVITGRGMGCSVAFGLAVIAACCGRKEADRIGEQIVYRA